MHNGHFTSARASIDHGDASVLFPVKDLDAKVLQHRDAELALNDVDSTDVLVVVPTSMASSYFLTEHALTAIPVAELSAEVRSQLGDALAAPIETFELVQIGKWTADSPNHSLAEYGGA
ncbi:hypothetical protein EKH57_00325 (plasmid) [Halorubrum sp. BOL3-1]|uniref:hypothetical protein n=1 Tax=Halorubrum sp. BOL3-1 TaxID=2497325 RepID=UPI001004D934|nr:hypothetical protein [Halorubrum sp. BOL3-1]QAU11400.1 hypothetical protein EKH57_00325 [Halorubrum sp. BOL3-1]